MPESPHSFDIGLSFYQIRFELDAIWIGWMRHILYRLRESHATAPPIPIVAVAVAVDGERYASRRFTVTALAAYV